MSVPLAVIINDIHYNISTLPIADAALNIAVAKSNDLEVPLIIAGDLHDTKANLRAECINAILATLSKCRLQPYVIRGNHDLINEKSDDDALGFLNEIAVVIRRPCSFDAELENYSGYLAHFIPYQHSVEEFRDYLKTVPAGSRLIIHQGLMEADMGHYIADHSALTKEDFSLFRTISGHYHRRQDIKCGRPQRGSIGLFTYTGNPYTLSYGEANDPEKGFHILMEDGSLEFIPTNLRRHVVYDVVIEELYTGFNRHTAKDLVWLKIRGPSDRLSIIDKSQFPANFKIDLIPTDKPEQVQLPASQTKEQVLDSIIDNMDIDQERKTRLKETWRTLA